MGRQKIHISDEESEMIRDFLLENILASLDLAGVSRAKYGPGADHARDYLTKSQGKLQVKDAAWIDYYDRIPENMRGLGALFATHGFNPHDAVTAALANPQLFIQSYEDTARRIAENAALLSCPSLGFKEAEVFAYLAGRPRLLSYTPATVAKTLKLRLMFLESPFVAFREGGHGSDFRPYRAAVAKNQVGSISDTLLRMAAAEISLLSPSKFAVRGDNYYGSYYVETTHSFHRTARGALEKDIVLALGFKGKGPDMDAPDGLLSDAEQKAQAERLKAKREDFLEASLELFDRTPAPTAPREWPLRVLSALKDDGDCVVPQTPEDSRRLRANLALAGLLRSYKLAK